MDQRIRERMTATKRIADDPRTDPGTREAARNRYAAMVSKYGDPHQGVNSPDFGTYANGQPFNFTSDNIREATRVWESGAFSMDDLVVAMHRMKPATTEFSRDVNMDRYFADLDRRNRQSHEQAMRSDQTHDEFLRSEAERAARWLENFTACKVEDLHDGRWYLQWKGGGLNRKETVRDQGLIDFAQIKGWDGK